MTNPAAPVKRVLVVHTAYRQAGGEDTAVRRDIEALERRGLTVELYEAQNPQGALPSVAALARSANNVSAADRVANVAREFDPDIVHIHNTWFALSPAIAPAIRNATNAGMVMTLHNHRLVCANGILYRDGQVCTSCVGSTSVNAVVHSCYRDSVVQSAFAARTITRAQRRGTWRDNIDRFIVLSPFSEGIFTAGGLPAEKLRVRPHPMDDPGQRTNAPSASSNFVFVGRLSEEKGCRQLIEGWAHTSGDITLTVIGDGPLRPELEQAADSRVTFTGQLPQEETLLHVKAARALVAPSQCIESFGLAIAEALAAGTPVIHSGLGPLPALAGEGGVDSGTAPHGIAKAISMLMSEPTVADLMSTDARNQYKRLLSPESLIERLLEIYGEARTARALSPGGVPS